MEKFDVYMAIAIILVIVVGFKACSTSAQRSNNHQKYCEEFIDYPMDKVPAKCIKYFKN